MAGDIASINPATLAAPATTALLSRPAVFVFVS